MLNKGHNIIQHLKTFSEIWQTNKGKQYLDIWTVSKQHLWLMNTLHFASEVLWGTDSEFCSYEDTQPYREM